jgi:NinB protein
MSRATIILLDAEDRATACKWIAKAEVGTRVEFKASKRSLEQNSRFWAMATDIATQVKWHDISLTPNDWKLLFLDALKQELRVVPNLDGNGFVNLGRSSSDLSKEEFSNLIELMFAFGANHGVVFHDPTQAKSS